MARMEKRTKPVEKRRREVIYGARINRVSRESIEREYEENFRGGGVQRAR